MTYAVHLRPAAARELRKLDRTAQDRVAKVIALLAEDPRPPAAKLLTGNEQPRLWRVRTGDYRIVYTIDDVVLIVLVIAVRHRREAYGR